jgi:hypothetical protein
MRLLNLLAPVLFTISAQAGDLSNIVSTLVLPAKNFGADWEMNQPVQVGNSIAPIYINRKLPHQPVVTVSIIDFKTPEAAKARWENSVGELRNSSKKLKESLMHMTAFRRPKRRDTCSGSC